MNAQLKFLLIVVLSGFLGSQLYQRYNSSDDTDNEKRSGMTTFTDHLTGCQYLGFKYFGRAITITPRLNPDGTQVCAP